jgi:hypothetical protein
METDMTSTLLAAFTDLDHPATGYVGFINISAVEDGLVAFTVRSREDVPRVVTHSIPLSNAKALLTEALANLREALKRIDPG